MFDDLLAANRRYSERFALRGIPSKAAKGFALVTCMDSRIEPLATLGLRPGDAKILRNAGGRVTKDVLRSLILATTFLGVNRIAVMHHTDCAMTQHSDSEIRARLGAAQPDDAEGWEFLTVADPLAALVADVSAVRQCALLPGEVRIEGWRYDVSTGLVQRVVPSEGSLD